MNPARNGPAEVKRTTLTATIASLTLPPLPRGWVAPKHAPHDLAPTHPTRTALNHLVAPVPHLTFRAHPSLQHDLEEELPRLLRDYLATRARAAAAQWIGDLWLVPVATDSRRHPNGLEVDLAANLFATRLRNLRLSHDWQVGLLLPCPTVPPRWALRESPTWGSHAELTP